MSRSLVFQQHQRLEIVPNRLFFSVTHVTQHSTDKILCFCIDDRKEFDYKPFYSDFGPPTIAQIHDFRVLINEQLKEFSGPIHMYCKPNIPKVTNTCLMICSYLIIEHHYSPAKAIEPITPLLKTFKPYRDASSYPSTYDLSLQSCLDGLLHAIQLGWYIPSKFDSNLYHEMMKMENGDITWIIPEKLLIFPSPTDNEIAIGQHFQLAPSQYADIFNELNANHVVRLSPLCYSPQPFTEKGITYTDLYVNNEFMPDNLLNYFFGILRTSDVVALHCKNGQEKSGALAGLSLISEFKFTAPEAIAWIRMCRSGTIVGRQQSMLIKFQKRINGENDFHLVLNSSQLTIYSSPPSARRSRTSLGGEKTLFKAREIKKNPKKKKLNLKVESSPLPIRSQTTLSTKRTHPTKTFKNVTS